MMKPGILPILCTSLDTNWVIPLTLTAKPRALDITTGNPTVIPTQPATVPKYPTPEEDAESPEEPMPEDLDDAYDDGYYIGIINTVDESDRHLGVCFNCGRAGHQWHECTEPLKDSLKAAIDHLNCIRQNKNIRKPSTQMGVLE